MYYFIRLDVLCVVDSHRLKSSGRSHSHVGPLFYELEGYILAMMSRGLCYCCDRTRQIGESGGLSVGKGGENDVES
jgi:hypothetical protein